MLSFTEHEFPEQLPRLGAVLCAAHSVKGKAGAIFHLREFISVWQRQVRNKSSEA